MFDNIIKRDGKVVPFQVEKIANAIAKAGRATDEFGEDVARRLAIKVVLLAEELIKEIPTVEQIQDVVEEVLLASPYKKTARAYIVYREQHARMREIQQRGGINLVDNYLDKMDWRVNENSNMSYSLQGLNCYISNEISSWYWLNKIYPEEVREAHINGDLHIHDLGILGSYCVGWDLQDLLMRGFGGVPGKVESKPPRHFRSALGQLVNFLYTLQGEAAGAQAVSSVDTLLAPFIRKDNLNYQQVRQAVQEFIFNLNVPTRVGFQTPFSNISLDITIPDYMKDEHPVIGGEVMEWTYRYLQPEIDMFNKALFEILEEGDAKGRVFTFPVLTINITRDFPWGSEVVNKLMQITAKYGIPYFANYLNSDMNPEDARSMCCRLRLDNRKLKYRGGGLFGANPLTGSIGVITINMPRIAYLSRGKTKEEFLRRLSKNMEIAKVSLEVKRKTLEKFTEAGLYPYSRYYLSGIKARIGTYWGNHFSTIGLVGMNEALLKFMALDITDEEGIKFAAEVLDFMRKKTEEFTEETGNLYNLEATPAEGCSHRLAKIDIEKFPDITCAGDGYDAVYYTNSTCLPVGFFGNAFEILEKQEPLQIRYTGGTVIHFFLGESPDPETAKVFIRSVFEKSKVPYITLTPTFSICQEHGYLQGEVSNCPYCGNTCEVYSRVTGYLRPVSQWNKGKKEEFKERRFLKSFDEVFDINI